MAEISERGTFQGNLSDTGSRVIESLTASRAVSASYVIRSEYAEKIGSSTSSIGSTSQSVYIANGTVTAQNKTIGGSSRPVYVSGGIVVQTANAIPTTTQTASWNSAAAWVTGNSSSIATSASVGAVQNIISTNSASWLKNDSTTYSGHFTPSSSGAGSSGSSTGRTYLKTISLDGKGHVVGVTSGSETVVNTDTKVTSVDNHYKPTQSVAKSATPNQAIVGIGLDAAGHLVSVTSSTAIVADTASYNGEAEALRTIITNNSSSWATNTDRYVDTASFVSTGSSGANGVKMTLTRAGSDTDTVVATIPVATTTKAGVVTGGQVTALNNLTNISGNLVNSASVATSAMNWITANSGNIGSHTGSYLSSSGGTLTGDLAIASTHSLTVGGNLYVNGTASYVNTQDLVVRDKLIVVSSGSTSQALSDGAGIAVQTASATTIAQAEARAARIQYRSSDNHFTASVGFVAPSFTGSLRGTASYAISASKTVSASFAQIAASVMDSGSLIVATASFALDHYEPTTVAGNPIGTTAARTYIKAINVDKNYHVISVTTGSETVTNTDRYVNTASFASTGSNGANGVKLTLTRAGSDTSKVIATIPVATSTAAGVVTGAQVGKIESGSAAHTWITANSSSALSTLASRVAVTQSIATLDRPIAFVSSSATGAQYIYSNPDLTINPASGSLILKKGGFISLGSASIAKPYAVGFRQTCTTTSVAFGIGDGGINKGIYQFAGATALTGSYPGIASAGWLLKFDGTTTASFALGHRVSASGFIGPLQGNATSATRFLAASGGAYQPIYLSASGVPKACSGYVVTAAQTASWTSAATWTGNNSASLVASASLAKTAVQSADSSSWDKKRALYLNTFTGSVFIKTSITGSANRFLYGTVEGFDHSYGAPIHSEFKGYFTATSSSFTSNYAKVIHLGKSAGTDMKWVLTDDGYVGLFLNIVNWYAGVKVRIVPITSTAAVMMGNYINSVVSGSAADNVLSSSLSTRSLAEEFIPVATKLVGTSGSTANPVYVSSGIPVACTPELVSSPILTGSVSTGTVTLAPGKFTDCGTLTGTTTFALGTALGSNRTSIYAGQFKLAGTARTINWPSTITWVEGRPDMSKLNCTYEFSICNNVGVLVRTA